MTPVKEGSGHQISFSQHKKYDSQPSQIKFETFLQAAQQDQRIYDSKNVSIQREISNIMNDMQMNMMLPIKNGGPQQDTLLLELKQKMNKINQKEDERQRIKEIDQSAYTESQLKHIVKTQAVVRGRKERKLFQKLKKNYRYRLHVIAELLQSEEDYVKDLFLIIEKIEMPMRLQLNLNVDHIQIIINNLHEIYQHNSSFIQELKTVNKSSFQYFIHIGDVCLKYAPLFKIYYSYCDNYNQADKLYQQLVSSNVGFQEFISTLNKDPVYRGLGWGGFFVKPIQRLPKYSLLLGDFLKHIETDHPLKHVFTLAFTIFKEVCNENNEKMQSITNSLKLIELQKNIGDSNGLQILESKRKFIFEDRMGVVLENEEKNLIVYGLTDLVLVCEPDPLIPCGYRLLFDLILTERSYCQVLPNKRYLHNLFKLVGKNHTVTFISQSDEIRQVLIEQFNQLMKTIKEKSNKIQKSNFSNYRIQVQVVGSQERESQVFRNYTVYVIEVTIDKVITKLYKRYSEIKSIQETVLSQFPDIKIPPLKPQIWFNKKDSKIIEGRKLEIEDYLLGLLINEQFQQKDKLFIKSILSQLGLDENFYQQPEMMKAVSSKDLDLLDNNTPVPNRLSKLSQIQDEKINSVQLRDLAQNVIQISNDKALHYDINSHNFSDALLDVFVMFHNEKSIVFKVPLWYRAVDLVKFIAEQIKLKEYSDFRVFESDKSLISLRPIMEDELIQQVVEGEQSRHHLNKLVAYFNPKVILFRKYLFLPSYHEETQDIDQKDSIRQDLMVGQLFYDIGSGKLTFKQEDYTMFICFYLQMYKVTYVDENVIFEISKKIIPKQMLKQKKNHQVIREVAEFHQILVKNVNLVSQKYGELNQTTQEVEERKRMISNCLFLNLVNKHDFYSIQIFQVEIRQSDFFFISKFVQTKSNKTITQDGFAIAVSYKGLHFIDRIRQIHFLTIKYSHFDEIIAYVDLLQLWLDDRNQMMTFKTTQGYQILNLIQDYQYLELELEKIYHKQMSYI